MDVCAACSEGLTIRIELSDEEAPGGGSSTHPTYTEIPDDVELLGCGCHFHWQCILDAYEMVRCPNCNRDVSSEGEDGQTRILCNLLNEGGVHEGLDIYPVLSEELYLKAYPEDRKPRAFLEFCRNGDVEAIVDLLHANDSSDDEMDDDGGHSLDSAAILRYQDPIGNLSSSLHIAVSNSKTDVVWLLLLLASTLESKHFPPQVNEVASSFGIAREDQAGQTDIRTLKDNDGKTAAFYAPTNLEIDVTLLDANL